jgi:hypothetical protein
LIYNFTIELTIVTLYLFRSVLRVDAK